MVEITDKLLGELGELNRSRSAQGARSKSTAFEWIIGGSGDRTRCDG
jgi:hydroxymethylglutaryl-CoA lyase